MSQRAEDCSRLAFTVVRQLCDLSAAQQCRHGVAEVLLLDALSAPFARRSHRCGHSFQISAHKGRAPDAGRTNASCGGFHEFNQIGRHARHVQSCIARRADWRRLALEEILKVAPRAKQHLRPRSKTVELQICQPRDVRSEVHARHSVIDAERTASTALCAECARAFGQEHAADCVLRPVLRYEDWLRELRASRPEDYWAKYVGYLSDYQ